MTGQQARDEARYCQHGDAMTREQKPGITTWTCPRERTCGRFEMRSDREPAPQEAREIASEALVTPRVLAMIRLLITDLDTARADGTVLTYGYIQHRLRHALETAKREVAREHPEPEITDEMVDRVVAVLTRLRGTPAGWASPDAARTALEAALRVPVGEGEQG